MTRTLSFLRGLGALAVLGVLVAGVPAGLVWGIGWPLPHALPNWAQLRADVSSPIPDTALLKALACVVWAGWAILAAAVTAEGVAAVRGHAARRLPLAGTLQPVASHLVAAVAVGLLSLTVRPAPATITGRPAPLSAVLLAATPPSMVTGTGFTASPGPARAASPPTTPASTRASPVSGTPAGVSPGQRYVVRRGDTLWGIAQSQLGDPLRWREIYALNDGAAQPDDATLSDPNEILPGWTLLLPAPASPPSPAPAAPTSLAPASTAPVAPPPPPASPSAATPTETSPRPAPRVAHPTASATGASGPRSQHPEARQTVEGPDRATPAPMVELPSGSTVALGLAAVLGAALAAARLHRRRRYHPERPKAGLTASEPLAGPTVRRLRQAHLQALDADRTPVPDRPPVDDITGRPRPAFRQPGAVPAGERAGNPLDLDLLAYPGIGLTGPGAPGVARALTLALLAEREPNAAEVLTVAPASDLLGRQDIPGLNLATDLDEALSTLEVELLHRARLLDAHDADNFAALLAAHPEEPLGPLVLVAPAPPSGARLHLAAILGLGARLGITAVLLGPSPKGTTLTVAGNGTVEQASGDGAGPLIGARLSTLTGPEAAELAAVLVASSGGEQPDPTPRPAETPVGDSQYELAGSVQAVEVRVLGPVRLLAGGSEIDTGLRTKARELLAYLATHPGGATDEAIVEAVWPHAAPGRGLEQFHTAVGNLRKVLRQATGLGEAMFVERNAGRYRLERQLVSVDLWRLQADLAQVQQAGDNDSKRAKALESIAAVYMGEFAEDANYEWAEGLRERLRHQAVDALTDLAELRETGGDKTGALGAAEHALAVDPYVEAVYRQVMRIQARLNKHEAVRRTYRQLEHHLADLDAEPEPLTRQLLTDLGTKPAHRPIHRIGC